VGWNEELDMNTALNMLTLLGVVLVLLLQLRHTSVITKLHEGVRLLELAWRHATGKPDTPAEKK
jgi:hypothetical protein